MKHPKFDYELFSIKTYLEWIEYLKLNKKKKKKRGGNKK